MRNATGITVHKYLINYRISMSKGLLINTDLSIEQIARQVGFESAAYYSLSFKKLMAARQAFTASSSANMFKNTTAESLPWYYLRFGIIFKVFVKRRMGRSNSTEAPEMRTGKDKQRQCISRQNGKQYVQHTGCQQHQKRRAPLQRCHAAGVFEVFQHRHIQKHQKGIKIACNAENNQ